MLLAMAQYQLKQIDQARSTLQEGPAFADAKLPSLDKPGPEFWSDWIIAHLFLREAKGLMNVQ